MYRGFLSFLVLGFLSVCVENVSSSCKDYFSYIQDEDGVHGLITINYFGFVSSLILRIDFTIGARLTTSYTGSLQPIGSKMNLLRDYNRGNAMRYKVYFPIVSPLPRVTTITINDKVVCYGQGDVLGQVQYITTISLQYKLFYQPGSNEIYLPSPQNAPSPAISQYNDINSFMIDNSQLEYVPPQRQTPPPVPEYFVTTRPPPIRKPIPKPSQPIPDPLSTQVELQTSSRCGINSRYEQPIAAPLIYNGVTYEPGEWPWLVAIYRLRFGNLNYICAGTLVSPKHVISGIFVHSVINPYTFKYVLNTMIDNPCWKHSEDRAGIYKKKSAHCIYLRSKYTHKKNVVVRAGIYSLEDWSENIVTRTLKELHIHESYNSSTLENDILIMTLKRAVVYNTMVQPACLWSGNAVLDDIVGKFGVVAGWGDNENGTGGMGIPRMVTMPVVSTDECRSSNSDFHKLTSSKTLCAGERSGSGPCLGDSGGGLYVRHQGRWRLRGIVSVALASNEATSQCDLNQFFVFTDTAQYMPWITYVMSIT